MPEGKHKSRSMRRVSKRTPGGRNVTHYSKRKPKIGVCYKCDDRLKGVKRERPYKMTSMPKSSKRPARPFAGVLCSNCMRREIISKVRQS